MIHASPQTHPYRVLSAFHVGHVTHVSHVVTVCHVGLEGFAGVQGGPWGTGVPVITSAKGVPRLAWCPVIGGVAGLTVSEGVVRLAGRP